MEAEPEEVGAEIAIREVEDAAAADGVPNEAVDPASSAPDLVEHAEPAEDVEARRLEEEAGADGSEFPGALEE